MAEALQRIKAVIGVARRLEAEVAPSCKAGLPNDIARAQGESQVAEHLRELLEEPIPFDMLDHTDLHYGLILDEERTVKRGSLSGEVVTVAGVRRDRRPPAALCVGDDGVLVEVRVSDLEGQCGLCSRRLDPNAQKGDPALDCGGDCNGCMAEIENRPL